MKGLKRDIIIIRREAFPNKHSLEQEVMQLNVMLEVIEKSDKLNAAFELIDLNHFRVVSKSHLLSAAIKSATQKPFEFLINKN